MLSVLIRKIKFILLIYLVGLRVSIEQFLYKYIFIMKKQRGTIYSTDKSGELVAVVTGGSSGIGMEIVDILHKIGYKVISGATTNSTVISKKVKQIHLDLACPVSIKNFVGSILKEHKQIHLLINCAGVMFIPLEYSKFGIEYHMAVNYIGHYLLAMQLIKTMNHSKQSKIINVTSSTYCMINSFDPDDWFRPIPRSYSGAEAYARSKLAVMMFTYKLQRFMKSELSEVHVVAYDPGTVKTQLYQHSGILSRVFVQWFGQFFMRSPSEAAEDIVEILQCSSPPQTCYKGWKKIYESTNKFSLNWKVQDALWNRTILEIKQHSNLFTNMT